MLEGRSTQQRPDMSACKISRFYIFSQKYKYSLKNEIFCFFDLFLKFSLVIVSSNMWTQSYSSWFEYFSNDKKLSFLYFFKNLNSYFFISIILHIPKEYTYLTRFLNCYVLYIWGIGIGDNVLIGLLKEEMGATS